jgi:predicted DNA-binding ribbon-helix-helix protein
MQSKTSSKLAHDFSEQTDSMKQDKSSLVSRNVTIGNHRTSIRLEPDMWNGLREICRREHATMHDIATVVSSRKAVNTSLTAAIRVFVMAYFRMAATEEGHGLAGHGPGGLFMNALISKRTEEQDNVVGFGMAKNSYRQTMMR